MRHKYAKYYTNDGNYYTKAFSGRVMPTFAAKYLQPGFLVYDKDRGFSFIKKTPGFLGFIERPHYRTTIGPHICCEGLWAHSLWGPIEVPTPCVFSE